MWGVEPGERARSGSFHITSNIFLYLPKTQYLKLENPFTPARPEEVDFNGQSIGGKMEIRLEKFILSNFKGYNLQKWKSQTGGFEEKNFSYTYRLLKENHSMESKIIEYGIILSHKYKVAQTEVTSRFLFTFLVIEHIHFLNTSSYFFYSHSLTSLENINPVTFWKYTKHPIMHVNMQPFY